MPNDSQHGRNEKQQQQKRIDEWAAIPIALEPGSEVSTWDRKTKTGVTGVVLSGKETEQCEKHGCQGIVLKIAARNGKVHKVPFSSVKIVTKTRRDVKMVYAKGKK